MNNILECFETEAFNELMQFSFDEVREAFNLNGYFVMEEQGGQFVQEASQAKDWYTEELKKILEDWKICKLFAETVQNTRYNKTTLGAVFCIQCGQECGQKFPPRCARFPPKTKNPWKH